MHEGQATITAVELSPDPPPMMAADLDAVPMPPAEHLESSALLPAALGLVPPSVTAQELDIRFAAQGAVLQPAVAPLLLARLADLGLIRVSQRHGRTTRYVATTLGQQYVDEGLDGAASLPLLDLEALRTDLLSTIAHELRTPLTAVRTSASLLLDPDLRPTDVQRRTLLEAVERNGERMQRLVGDILELSRYRSGNISLQLRQFRAVALAESAIAAIAPIAALRHLQVLLVCEADTGHRVYGDRHRLEQALLNLVSNAEHFSPDGGVVTVRLSVAGTLTSWSVTDAGPGISVEDQARLFERFFVGRNDLTGPRAGVGLGLPTSLAIAQAHGGNIEVRSELGMGSTFALVVPTDGPDEP